MQESIGVWLSIELILLVSKLKEKTNGTISKSYCTDILLRRESWDYKTRTSTSIVDDVFMGTINVLSSI